MLSHAFDLQDEQFQHAFAVLRSGIDQRAFPGAAVAITHQGKLIAYKGLGHFTYDAASPAVTADTILRSRISHQSRRHHSRLHDPVRPRHVEARPAIGRASADFAESLANDPRRRRSRSRMLLAHSSGLPAYVKLFQTAHNQDELYSKPSKSRLPPIPEPAPNTATSASFCWAKRWKS